MRFSGASVASQLSRQLIGMRPCRIDSVELIRFTPARAKSGGIQVTGKSQALWRSWLQRSSGR